MDLCDGLYFGGCEYTNSDGDYFLCSPIFNRTGANILSTPIFVTFSARGAGTTSRYSAGESPLIKADRPVATTHLATACGGINNFWKTLEIISKVLEKSAAVDSANSKEMLPCMHQHFFNKRFLLMQGFCWRENFVNTSILSTPTFCRRQHFIDVNILSTQIFSADASIFVGDNILSSPIFCQRQYFCLCLKLRMITRIKDDYLLIMIVFCVYHDYY
jgi:hypothetical protein